MQPRERKKSGKEFERRKNDHLNSENEQETLAKDRKQFEFDESAKRYGGLSSEGPHIKKTSKSKEPKVYYLAPHDTKEYFGLEILNQIGFNTPKGRPIKIDEKEQLSATMAIKSIENYIPIAAYIRKENGPPIFVSDNDDLQEIYDRYSLDIERQVVIDSSTGDEYKVSGNLFTADIGAKLLADGDFQPEQGNVGLAKIGNRFYAYFIDKEGIKLSGKTYEENIKETDIRVHLSLLFKSATIEQQLFILNQIQIALKNDAFRKIFLNDRVQATKELSTNAHEYAENFNKTAYSALQFYDANNKILLEFQEREALRNIFITELLTTLELEINKTHKEMLKENLVEDLRGPYYQHLFFNEKHFTKDDLKNNDLKEAVVNAIKKELKNSLKEEEESDIPEQFGPEHSKFYGKTSKYSKYKDTSDSQFFPIFSGENRKKVMPVFTQKEPEFQNDENTFLRRDFITQPKVEPKSVKAFTTSNPKKIIQYGFDAPTIVPEEKSANNQSSQKQAESKPIPVFKANNPNKIIQHGFALPTNQFEGKKDSEPNVGEVINSPKPIDSSGSTSKEVNDANPKKTNK